MHPAAQHFLLATLRRHIGKALGVNARTLVQEVNAAARAHVNERAVRCFSNVDLINERDLRTLVVELRLQGHHVCAHPSSGYYLAANTDELQESTKFLKDRAMSSLQQVAAMERVSLPDLFGQLHLPT